MLKSPEHEICPANKSQITNNCEFFLAKHIQLIWAWKEIYNLGARTNKRRENEQTKGIPCVLSVRNSLQFEYTCYNQQEEISAKQVA